MSNISEKHTVALSGAVCPSGMSGVLVFVLASPARPQFPVLCVADHLAYVPCVLGTHSPLGVAEYHGRPSPHVLVWSVAPNPRPPITSISWGSRAEGVDTQ